MKQLLFFVVVCLQMAVAAQTGQGAGNFLEQGNLQYEAGHYKEALGVFQQAADEAAKSKHYDDARQAYNGAGNSYSQLGEHVLALRSYQQALKVPGLDPSDSHARTYKNIGALYSEQKDFDSAMEYYQLAIKDARRTKDRPMISDCLNNIGVVQEQLGDYKGAVSSYTGALEIYRKQNNQQRIAMALNNLAIVHKELRNFDKAKNFYEEALLIAVSQNDSFTIAATNNNIGNLYAAMGNHSEALTYCRLAYEQSAKIGATEVQIEALDGMALAYEHQSDFKNALKFRKRYEEILDTYISSSRSSELAQLRVKYESEIKDAKIRELEQNNIIRKLKIEEQKQRLQSKNMMLAAIAIAVVALITAGLFWIQRQRVRAESLKQKAILDTEEQERLRIARDIHDDLGSGLSKINFLSELILQKTANDPEIHGSTLSVQETATKMIGNMRDLIWALNPENTTVANLIARIREYTTDYLSEYPIMLTYKLPDHPTDAAITKESHRNLFMVVKESLNNVVKHSDARAVTVEISLQENLFTMVIADDGKGIDATKPAGNGLINMRKRINGLDGNFESESGPQGMTIRIAVPLSSMIRELPVQVSI